MKTLSVTLVPCERRGVQDFEYVVRSETDYDLRFVESTPRNFEFVGSVDCPNDLWRAALTAVQLTAARRDIQAHVEYLARQGYVLV